MASSRHALGARWGEYYNRAPLWRFWLGAGICGEPTIGALMASVDGVGRAFPLTMIATGEGGPPPPELEPNDDWFSAAEALMLGALDRDASLEKLADAMAALPSPRLRAPAAAEASAVELDDRAIIAHVDSDRFDEAFERSRRLGGARYDGLSFWWTLGGEDFPPVALSVVGLPGPNRFVEMLTGAFAERPSLGDEAHVG
jgi:type VI secretion system protein ImpM